MRDGLSISSFLINRTKLRGNGQCRKRALLRSGLSTTDARTIPSHKDTGHVEFSPFIDLWGEAQLSVVPHVRCAQRLRELCIRDYPLVQGYESASQFSREFKRLFGRTPVEEVRDMRESFTLSPAVRFGT
ncbi:hypothetical protein BOSP111201_24315 [Bordetella sputigena]